jgi:CubicO group peptidase (beta-lactamase class C family)
MSIAQALQRISQMWAILPPDTMPVYSNLGFDLLGNVLADHVKMPYESLIYSDIVAPLGLKNTGVNITTADPALLALPYLCKLLLLLTFLVCSSASFLLSSCFACSRSTAPSAPCAASQCLADFGWANPSGAMYSNVEDLAALISFFFRQNSAANPSQGTPPLLVSF